MHAKNSFSVYVRGSIANHCEMNTFCQKVMNLNFKLNYEIWIGFLISSYFGTKPKQYYFMYIYP